MTEVRDEEEEGGASTPDTDKEETVEFLETDVPDAALEEEENAFAIGERRKGRRRAARNARDLAGVGGVVELAEGEAVGRGAADARGLGYTCVRKEGMRSGLCAYKGAVVRYVFVVWGL